MDNHEGGEAVEGEEFGVFRVEGTQGSEGSAQ